MVRLTELIIPWVTVCENSNPRGFPIAIAGSPTFNVEEVPNSANDPPWNHRFEVQPGRK